MGAAGAHSTTDRRKVGRVELKRGGKVEIIRNNIIETIKPGETVTNMNPGGGGYGDPFERPVEKVVWDVKNGLVSIDGAARGLWRRHHRPARRSTSTSPRPRALRAGG